jgi:hypothetical protein
LDFYGQVKTTNYENTLSFNDEGRGFSGVWLFKFGVALHFGYYGSFSIGNVPKCAGCGFSAVL